MARLGTPHFDKSNNAEVNLRRHPVVLQMWNYDLRMINSYFLFVFLSYWVAENSLSNI